MKEERVKFFSSTDMASGRNLTNAETILEKLTIDTEVVSVNDAIELYNIKQYIDSECYLVSWSTEQTEKYKKIVNTIIPNKIGRFCSKIDDNNILDLIRSLDFQYYDDFWDLKKH